MDKITIAVDGPAGAGKSTIAKIIAERLSIEYIDTGAMYRALTYKIIKENINLENIIDLKTILEKTDIDFKDKHIYLDGNIVDKEIRDNKISNNVSFVAKIKEVREKLVDIQRKLANNKSVIMDGRDIGSFVLPNAKYKFFVTATPEERGLRRFNELQKNNENIKLNDIINEIKKRDEIDSSRSIAPLIKTSDAVLIDTTNKSIEQCVNEIVCYLR